jgi:CUB domain
MFHHLLMHDDTVAWCCQNVEITIHNVTTESEWDQVMIYNGYDDQAKLLTPSLSGSLSTFMPEIIQTTQKYLYIKFTSDSSTTNEGFRATYTSKHTYYVIVYEHC